MIFSPISKVEPFKYFPVVIGLKEKFEICVVFNRFFLFTVWFLWVSPSPHWLVFCLLLKFFSSMVGVLPKLFLTLWNRNVASRWCYYLSFVSANDVFPCVSVRHSIWSEAIRMTEWIWKISFWKWRNISTKFSCQIIFRKLWAMCV